MHPPQHETILFFLRILLSLSDGIIQSLICSVMASQSFSAAEFLYSLDVVIDPESPDDLFNRGLNHEVAAASLPYKTPSCLTKSSTTG